VCELKLQGAAWENYNWNTIRLKMVKCRLKVGFIILASGMLLALVTEILAKERYNITKQPIIVIDPGHGGHSSGVQGPTGVLEKTVTLALAQTLARRLETDYRIKISRTDDYDLALTGRTAIANRSQAALFISLHTGGSFLHQTNGVTVFYFDRKEKEAPFSEPTSDGLFTDNPARPHWKTIQKRHLIDSKILAFTLQHHFEAVRPDAKIRVQRAPLTVLMGANMPAVLIEVGYLSNPVEEKKLLNPEYLLNIAASIEKGINEFFSKKIWHP